MDCTNCMFSMFWTALSRNLALVLRLCVPQKSFCMWSLRNHGHSVHLLVGVGRWFKTIQLLCSKKGLSPGNRENNGA